MEKNYYEILEVDRNASPEVIKKAYNTLVKKYHPDLQEGNLKQIYEDKIKIINEAYEVISIPKRREQYDAKLKELEFQAEELIQQKMRQQEVVNENNNTSTPYTQTNSPKTNNNQYQSDYYQEQIRKAQNKAYHDAYIQDFKNRGYKIRYQKTFKDYLKDLIALVLTVLILFLLWQLPFVQNLFKNNILIQTIVNIFSKK